MFLLYLFIIFFRLIRFSFSFFSKKRFSWGIKCKIIRANDREDMLLGINNEIISRRGHIIYPYPSVNSCIPYDNFYNRCCYANISVSLVFFIVPSFSQTFIEVIIFVEFKKAYSHYVLDDIRTTYVRFEFIIYMWVKISHWEIFWKFVFSFWHGAFLQLPAIFTGFWGVEW